MAKSIFPTIPVQQEETGAARLLGVQSAPLTLTDTGTALFGSSLGPFRQGAVLRFGFEASFVYPLYLKMESPGAGTYVWALTGLPSPAQDDETAYSSHQLSITADTTTGEPVASGPFLCLIPALGLQAALVELDSGPASPIELVGPEWIFRLAAPSGQVTSAWLEEIKI